MMLNKVLNLVLRFLMVLLCLVCSYGITNSILTHFAVNNIWLSAFGTIILCLTFATALLKYASFLDDDLD